MFQRHVAADDQWLPINPADLALKDNPASSGSTAMILYRQEHTDASNAYSTEYYRIKIFTEAGKKWGDVEIPFVKGRDNIKDVRARTIAPDGSIVPFTGQVFEKEIVKAGGFKVLEKTFTMPAVQPGCIVEYKYKVQHDTDYYWNIGWEVQEDLFTRDADFSIHPPEGPEAPALYSRSFGLPQEVKPEKQKNGDYTIQLHNISGLTEEDYMLPKDMLRGRVEFYFKSPYESQETTAQYWKETDKKIDSAVDNYINKKKALQQIVAQTTAASDSAEAKLRKLYARVQTIRNLAYEDHTTQEWKREKLKINNNVEDVLSRNYGSAREINDVFIGLARAAGFEANQVLLAPRDERMFMPNLQDASELDDDIVRVKANGQEFFLDPAAKFYPFGLLPWNESGIPALLVNKDGGDFVQIPRPKSSDAVIERHGALQLETDGSLAGTLDVNFAGIPACSERQEERSDDETARKKDIGDLIKGWLPSGAKFEITKISGWDGSGPLAVTGTLSISGFATSVGHRILLPFTPFVASEPRSFESAKRVNAIYFHYPYQQRDDIVVKLPAGYSLESVPHDIPSMPQGAIQYSIAGGVQSGTFEVKRNLDVEGFLYGVSNYPAIRNIFQMVRTGDNEQAVLDAPVSASQK
ncbi:MAG TPA: DUF3857 domain-containing protein [Candidatus Acidoferrum sp.]|nr:DUF3857 domain-containing protein [Candidatus Acidoferrum sp.]